MSQIFKDYIESSTLPSSIKAVYRIDKTLKEKHKFYLNLIPFLTPLYPKIESINIEKVSSGAYLYFRFLLDIDALIDQRKDITGQPNFQRIAIAFEVYEESIKILSSVFDIDSPFWTKFRHFKSEYVKAIFAEKQFSKTRQSITEEQFEKLASGKSAICYASVSALSTLNGPTSYDLKLEECLRHIHIALQYLDDIEDFKIDSAQNQWSYPQYLVEKYLEAKFKTPLDASLTHKYLFVSGIADSLLEKAISHYQSAIEIGGELGLANLNEFLQKQLSFVYFFKKEISLLIEKTTCKTKKSQNIQSHSHISDTVFAGQAFLTKNIQDGIWSDFMTSAGKGDLWITGFVGMLLSETTYPQEILKNAISSLAEGSAFNNSMINDADSISFKVGFHRRMNKPIPEKLTDDWLSFMKPDGSFSTYQDKKKLRDTLQLSEDTDVGAWTSAHTCVTAAAAYVLSEIPPLEKEYTLSSNYLSSLIKTVGIKAYWWTNDLYTVSFALLALGKDQTKNTECKMLTESILRQQHGDGFWHNQADNNPNAFYTALSLKALLSFEPESHKSKIQQGINWLLNNQTTDGSWLTGRILRIPATDVMDPQSVSKWRNSSFGVNTLVDDHNRVFTTAMVVNVLYLYSISHLN